MRTPYAVPACCLVGARMRRTIRHGASHARSCSATRCVPMTRSSPYMRHARLPQPTHYKLGVRCPSPSCATYRSHLSTRRCLLLVASGAARKPRVLVMRLLPRSPRAGSEAAQPPLCRVHQQLAVAAARLSFWRVARHQRRGQSGAAREPRSALALASAIPLAPASRSCAQSGHACRQNASVSPRIYGPRRSAASGA
jgi:hypothetical protein